MHGSGEFKLSVCMLSVHRFHPFVKRNTRHGLNMQNGFLHDAAPSYGHEAGKASQSRRCVHHARDSPS